MQETEFHRLADATLDALADGLEEADGSGQIEVEYQGGVIAIDLPGGKQLIVSKHTASRQIWLSSPVSGGLHFSHAAGGWQLADGRTLNNVLAAELKTLAGVVLA